METVPKVWKTTPVRIRRETIELLVKLKQHPRETYDDVITRLCLLVLRETKK